MLHKRETTPAVVKFGGSVLRSVTGFRNMVEIVGQLLTSADRERPSQLLVVVSAFASTTRDLEKAARIAQTSDLQSALHTVDSLIDLHNGFAAQLLSTPESRVAIEELIVATGADVKSLLQGIAITRQLTERTLDRVIAHGELLALHIARHVIAESGIDAAWTDARRLVVTNEDFGAAIPLIEKTRIHVAATLLPLLHEHDCVLIQGFVGATENGVVTTMGRESSTLTATLLAELIGATSVTLFTNVEGVRSADPFVFSDTLHHRYLSYDQANIAAHHGLKLLYATTIEPAKRAGIPVKVVSASNPNGPATIISETSGGDTPILSLEQGPELATISVTLCNLKVLFAALGKLAMSFNDSDTWFVVANPHEHVFTITLPETNARSVATLLHQEILRHYKEEIT